MHNGKKVLIYLEILGEKFDISCKCFGTHYLEQTIDNEGNIIKEIIKVNPHYVDFQGFVSTIYD